jgi:hypothetical protein
MVLDKRCRPYPKGHIYTSLTVHPPARIGQPVSHFLAYRTSFALPADLVSPPCLPGVRSPAIPGPDAIISLDFLEAWPYNGSAAWQIEASKQVEDWLLKDLEDEAFAQIRPAIDELEQQGPTLGRPLVDRIKGSRHRNMKGPSPVDCMPAVDRRTHPDPVRIRPARQVILLLGGDKTGNWKGWYQENIRQADELYDKHLAGAKI